MSETLRDLVVSLSLQTDNFTRNIKSVNKQIQEAESKFRLAAAGIEGFEKTATGLSTQLSTLERRLQLQRDAVMQYEKALTAANTKLQECYNRQNDYAQRLTDAKTAQQALKEQVGLAAQQYRTFAATLGETDSATIASKANLDQLKVEYRAQCAEVKKLTGQNAALKKSTQNAADAVSQANINLNGARAAVKTTESEISKCNRSLALAQTNDVFKVIACVDRRERRAPQMWDVGREWDRLLQQGHRLYARCGSDFHHHYTDGGTDYLPGEFVQDHVWVEENTYTQIVDAYRNGRFFCTVGNCISDPVFTAEASGDGCYRVTLRLNANCPMERQQMMYKKVLSICERDFDFADFEECSKFFKGLINLFRQMNYAEWQSEKFYDYDKQIDAYIANH